MLSPRRASALLALPLALLGCGAAPRPKDASTVSPPAAAVVARESSGETVASLGSSPHVRFGVPVDADGSDDYLLDRGAYVASYNRQRGEANWVAWRLMSNDVGTNSRSDDFRADERLPAELRRVSPSEYVRSGYDKGHLCPSAHRTQDANANSATFLMTNMMPQVHALNAGPWKGVESYERELVTRQGLEVYVVAGGIFGASPKTIGQGVAVPALNYRVTIVVQVDQGPSDVTDATPVFAVEMPNDASAKGHRWRDFEVSVDQVEAHTGYDFLSALPDDVEARLEAAVHASSPEP